MRISAGRERALADNFLQKHGIMSQAAPQNIGQDFPEYLDRLHHDIK